MEAKETIGALFGLKQEEMAMLLQVTRSQWSHYASGSRSLPLDAVEKLAEIVSVVTVVDKPTKDMPSHEEKMQVINAQLHENEYQQYLLSKEIADFEKKRDRNLTVLRFTQQMLQAKGQLKKTFDMQLLTVLENKAGVYLQKNGWPQLRQLQMKLKLLEHEEVLLREEMGE